MTDAHPTKDEVLGAFGDAWCLVSRFMQDHACSDISFISGTLADERAQYERIGALLDEVAR